MFEPGADFTLALDDTMMVVGRRENINRFEREYGAKQAGPGSPQFTNNASWLRRLLAANS